jgi:acyl transferase domain-containing protein
LTPILTAQGIQSRKLNVSHAFHSPLMEPMVDAFAEVARTITYHPPRIPIISKHHGQAFHRSTSERIHVH